MCGLPPAAVRLVAAFLPREAWSDARAAGGLLCEEVHGQATIGGLRGLLTDLEQHRERSSMPTSNHFTSPVLFCWWPDDSMQAGLTVVRQHFGAASSHGEFHAAGTVYFTAVPFARFSGGLIAAIMEFFQSSRGPGTWMHLSSRTDVDSYFEIEEEWNHCRTPEVRMLWSTCRWVMRRLVAGYSFTSCFLDKQHEIQDGLTGLSASIRTLFWEPNG